MQLSDFFEPIYAPKATAELMPIEDTMVNQVDYGLESGFSEDMLATYQVAIIGIEDGKNSLGNEGCKDAASVIRSGLAGLRRTTKKINIIDLGNLRGHTLDDRYFAAAEVIDILSSYGVRCLLIGGGQDYVLPTVRGLAKKQQDLSLAIIDSKIDLGVLNSDYCSQSFLSQIAYECKNKLFDLNLLGVQKYLVGESQENRLAELGWGHNRLKDLRKDNICSAEPLLRDVDLISFDVSAIQRDYMPYFSNINVNGFTGYEACQLAWYAGVGGGFKVFGLQEYNPSIDKSNSGGMLCAEIVWHLLDGIAHEMKNTPSESSSDYKISVVHLQDFDVDMRFYTNRANNRWWIEVPWKNDVKMLACDKHDYLLAQGGELPDKWWKFFRKDK